LPKYSDEFKAAAVERLRSNPGESVRRFALELGIGPSTLRRWMTEARENEHGTNAIAANEFHQSSVRNLFQAQKIEQHLVIEAEKPEERPLLVLQGILPQLAADRQERAVDGDLANALARGGTAVVCQVLSGMGGVGKTQVASAYAHRQLSAGEVELLLWVRATSRESIVEAFADAAVAVYGETPGDNESNAKALLSWLARPIGRRWLIVLDDIADPNDLIDLWPPSVAFGRTVVTTRRRDAALDGSDRHRVNVDLFTESESAHYLSDRLDGDAERLRGAADLARALGHLPLALSQAAAFILDHPGLTCEGYLARFTDRATKLAQLCPEALPDGHQLTVNATWSLSIERADSYEPKGVATPLLQLACLLDPNAIPEAFFVSDCVQRYVLGTQSGGGALSRWKAKLLGPEVGNEEPALRRWKIESILSRMHQLSLLDFDGMQVRVHALVQRAVFDDLGDRAHANAARASADAFAEIWPRPDSVLAETATLRSNIDYLLHRSEAVLFANRIPSIFITVGLSLSSHGQLSAATEYLRSLHEIAERRIGEHAAQTLEVRHALAVSLAAAGQVEEAVTLFESVAHRRRKLLGAAHPDSLTAVRDLKFWRNLAQSEVASAGLRSTFIP
jgi:transposase-like protein